MYIYIRISTVNFLINWYTFGGSFTNHVNQNKWCQLKQYQDSLQPASQIKTQT